MNMCIRDFREIRQLEVDTGCLLTFLQRIYDLPNVSRIEDNLDCYHVITKCRNIMTLIHDQDQKLISQIDDEATTWTQTEMNISINLHFAKQLWKEIRKRCNVQFPNRFPLVVEDMDMYLVLTYLYWEHLKFNANESND